MCLFDMPLNLVSPLYDLAEQIAHPHLGAMTLFLLLYFYEFTIYTKYTLEHGMGATILFGL